MHFITMKNPEDCHDELKGAELRFRALAKCLDSLKELSLTQVVVNCTDLDIRAGREDGNNGDGRRSRILALPQVASEFAEALRDPTYASVMDAQRVREKKARKVVKQGTTEEGSDS